MQLMRYQPWSLLRRTQGELDRMVSELLSDRADWTINPTRRWLPNADINEEEDRFVLHVDLPGVDPNDIEVSAEKRVLTVKGERKLEEQDQKEDYTSLERVHGIFYRRFHLPDVVDSDAIEAKEKHGVLTIVLPKKAAAQPRRIEIVH